jgi:hypothetical protein
MDIMTAAKICTCIMVYNYKFFDNVISFDTRELHNLEHIYNLTLF